MVPIMASATPKTPGTARPPREQSEARRRQQRIRLAVVLGALVLVAGIVAVVQVATDKGPAPTAANAEQLEARQASDAEAAAKPKLRAGGKLTGTARDVVERFVVSTLGRKDLAAAWEMAGPDLRNAVTKKQWLEGELPIPPFPVDRLLTTGYDVLESSSTRVLLQVLLVPEEETGYVPIRYDMTIERAAATEKDPWKVTYFLPYAPPGIGAEVD